MNRSRTALVFPTVRESHPRRGPGRLRRWRDRAGAGRSGAEPGQHANRPGRWSAALTGAAAVVLWATLAAPYRLQDLGPSALLHVPLELPMLVGVLAIAPARVRRPVATAAGLLVAVLVLLKALDLGFAVAFDRPFNLLTDRGYAGSAVSLLLASTGAVAGSVLLVLAALLVMALLVGLPLAALRLGALARRDRTRTARAVGVLVLAWVVLAVSGVTVGGGPLASTSAISVALDQQHRVLSRIRDERQFRQELAEDPLAPQAARNLLSGLRGKDVLLVFVESYGRFALEGPSSAPVTQTLDRGTTQLRRSGFRARSGWLTSPTFGGLSWLAHSTLQSGLWVDDQARYERLLASRRTSLMALFRRAGWRTVADIPSSERPWPEGKAFYRFRTMYGGSDVGYLGPRFGYARVPDQYTLAALHRLELDRPGRRNLMAEVDLDSSHTPWAPLPRLVPWDRLAQGAVYDPMPAEGPSRTEVWSSQSRLRAAYARSVVYSLRSLVSFIRRYGEDDLVLVVLGDHQPNAYVTGSGASHDVPVSVIAHDPAVLRRIDGWGWQPGLRPDSAAPVWRMDAFRGRFLGGFADPPRAGSRR